MNTKIKIPVAMQIRIDDVAWHRGADERHISRPSRSGMTRNHSHLDYPVINEIGKAINMKISCALCLGEWDKNNRLRGEKNVTWDENGWDRKNSIDYNYAEKAFRALEDSEYISYTYHGLLHGFYHNGLCVTEREHYPFRYDKKNDTYIDGETTWLSEEELRRRFDLFFQIMDDWGFEKKVLGFASGNGQWGVPSDEGNKMYANVFKDYGISVWHNSWGTIDDTKIDCTEGVVCLRGAGKVHIPWNAYDVDPDILPLCNDETEEYPRPDFGCHWPNFIRYNPQKNHEVVEPWVNYFKKTGTGFWCYTLP